MRSLNLDQLRTLIEVAALGNFSAAARRLNLTQPAVSLHIRELEHRFGVRLIERMGSRAYATAPGRELVERAGRIFRECDGTEAAMRRFRHGWIGSVHIGTTLTALNYELPPILKKLRRDHPGIDLLVTNMPTRDSVENVMKNAIDLALVTLPVKAARLRITPLRAETLVAIFPAGQRDIPDEVTPEYVARQPLVLEHPRGAVHALVTQWLSKHLPLQRTPMHIGTVDAMKRVVASNLGMSIVPDVAVVEPAPDLIVRSLKPKLPCTLALIEHRNKPKEPAFDIVRAALLELRTLGANASDDGTRREKRAKPLPPLGRMRKGKRSAHAF
ncbi:MAG: LysR family transcriptional regulator [Beijerinckiaceae bacterium]